MEAKEVTEQNKIKFTKNLNVAKVVDVLFSKDGDRQYLVCWEETWEREEELLCSCKDMLLEYWEQRLLAHISQEKETEAIINKRHSQGSVYTTYGEVQDFLPSDDHPSTVLTPLYQFASASEFSEIEIPRTVKSEVTSPAKPITSSRLEDLPDQYENVGFAKSIREKFAENVNCKNDVDFIEHILRREKHRQDEQHSNANARQSRQKTIQRFLSFKKGVRVVCDICDESFADKKSLMRHKVCRHEKFSPHQCTICKKMFFKPGDVRRHEPIHHDLREFRCQFCEKTYKTNNHLQRHVKAKHKKRELTSPTDLVTPEFVAASPIAIGSIAGSPIIEVKNETGSITTCEDADIKDDDTIPINATIHVVGKHDQNKTNDKENDNKNDPVLQPVSMASGGVSDGGESGGGVLLVDTNVTLLNNTSATLQSHVSMNGQFFSRSDVQICLVDRGFF